MALDTVNRWLTLSTNIAVLAGIIALVVEVNQNTRAMNAASRDEAISHSLSFFEQAMDNQVIALAEFKRRSGAELDDFERSQLMGYQYYNFRIFENIYIQYRQGLFSDEEWEKWRRTLDGVLERNEIALDMWKRSSDDFADDFRREIDLHLTND